MNSKIKHISRDFGFFCIAGCIATAVQYIILILLVENFSVHPANSSSVGFFIGAIVNYYLNRHMTFKSKKAHRKAVVQFFCVATIGFGLNYLFMSLGTHWFSLPYLIVQVFATLLVLFWNFIANRHWVFHGI